ncbi:hypothetical protein VAR608DRAFT_4878 [Variovorax sp. HW608]|uniref:hypothetical protein n=1 Tax=Variovorax sp. HW608 TaxID=1034889 RepID=UPI0008200650|nr:hypothetical protein [Variovorax sp. HW608]SCK49074.1 hypothetical protein VAR608DRAFT_4878 [Variovorax sp. HW608]
MNAQDVDRIAQVIELALADQRQTLEALIELRRAECMDAAQASEVAREQVSAAEDRLREFLQRSTTDAALAMQQAAAAELARSQDLLMRRMQTAEALDAEVRNLCAQLQQASPKSDAVEIHEQVTAAEDRLRDLVEDRTVDAVSTMRQAAAAEVARSQDLLLRRLQMVDDLAAEVRALHVQLQQASPKSDATEIHEQVTAAEDRLRELVEHRTVDAVSTMRQAAAAEVARSHDLLLRRLQMVDDLASEVRGLHAQLQQASSKSDAAEIREQVTAAEDRLRELVKDRTGDAVSTMRQAAAAEVARSQDLLLRRLQMVDDLAAEVRALHVQLQQASPKADAAEIREQVSAAEDRLCQLVKEAAARELAGSQDLLLRRLQAADDLAAEVRALHAQLLDAKPRSAYDIARAEGFDGSQAEWLASLKAEAPAAHEVAEALMLTHAGALEGRPGTEGKDGTNGKDGQDGAGIDTPAWAPGIHREGALVQAYMGQFYRALRDTTDEPYGSRDWQRVGTLGLHLAKPYAEGAQYALGDLVMHDFSTFVIDASGELHLFAARGPAGEKGRDGKGRDGTNGKDGNNGRDGYGIEDMQLKGGMLAVLARNASGQLQDFAVDLVPMLETLGEAIEQRLIARFTRAPTTPPQGDGHAL